MPLLPLPLGQGLGKSGSRHEKQRRLSCDASAGFTLLEVLVALVIFGLLLAGLAQGTRFGLNLAGRQVGVIAATADLDSTDRVLRGLISQMDAGSLTAAPTLDAHRTSLGFTTNFDAVAPNAGIGAADVGLGVTPDHRLVLRWAAHVHAARLGPATPAAEATLLPGVARVEYAYCCNAGGQFVTDWTVRDLPSLVRIIIVPEAAGRQSWPPILAATVRSRLNG